MLNITKNVENGKAVIALEGRLDTITSRDLSKEIDTVMESISELVLDFDKLGYISSAGLRVIVDAMNRMGGKDKMKIINVKKMIMEVFDVTGFSSVLNIEQ